MKPIVALLTIVAASTFRDWIAELWHEPVHHLTCHGTIYEFEERQQQ